MIDEMSTRQQVKLFISAFRGDRDALMRILESTLPRAGKKIMEAKAEIDYRRQHQWDVEATRQQAMEADEPEPQAAINAFSEVHEKILRVLAYTPAVLMADAEEVEEMNELWTDALYDLVITLHNPNIRYAILIGYPPEVRSDIENYMGRMEREAWETIDALAEGDTFSREDLPPETKSVLETVAQSMQAEQASAEAASTQPQDGDVPPAIDGEPPMGSE